MKATDATSAPTYQSRLKQLYHTSYLMQLREELELRNLHNVPRLEKIVVCVGLGKAKDDKKAIEIAMNTLRKITGQHPVETTAKKSIASFKLRAGNKIGLKVTLRGNRMYEFADRLINVVLPRLRDFHGVDNSSFDRQGNYNIGLVDQSVFPELTYEDTTTPHGLQIILVIKSSNAAHSKALLKKFGVPFAKEVTNG